MKKILVTGSAGFIGANLVKRLFNDMAEGTIVGVDNLNDYYDPSLKEYRLSELDKSKPANINYQFVKGSIADRELINRLFAEYKFDIVVNLAAQAGVRYSIDNPDAYIQSNIIGFYNILEACRHNPVEHLVYASSSSVYGGNKKVPFSVDDRVDNPVSLYAATKKSNELMAHCYSKLYNIPSTGLRFSPSMAPPDGPTWPTLASPTSCSAARPYRYTTDAKPRAVPNGLPLEDCRGAKEEGRSPTTATACAW